MNILEMVNTLTFKLELNTEGRRYLVIYMTKYRLPRCLTNLFHDPGGFIHKTALTLVGRNTRLSMRTIYAYCG